MTDEEQLIADLNATFPRADARPLAAWSGDPKAIGAVVCGEAQIAPGEEIGPYIARSEPPYDGYLHTGFVAWAQERGWYVEVYEPGTLWLVPLAAVLQEA